MRHSLYLLEHIKEFMKDHMVCILWSQTGSMVLPGQLTMTNDHHCFFYDILHCKLILRAQRVLHHIRVDFIHSYIISEKY